MKNLTEYITESSSKPTSFDKMLTDLIESDVEEVIIAHADNNKDLVYIWPGQDMKLYVAYANKTFSNTEILLKASPDDEIFKGNEYKTKLIKNIESSNHANILTKFVADIKNDTTKVCNIYGKVSQAIWQGLDKIE